MGRSRKPLWSVWATVGSNPTLSASIKIGLPESKFLRPFDFAQGAYPGFGARIAREHTKRARRRCRRRAYRFADDGRGSSANASRARSRTPKPFSQKARCRTSIPAFPSVFIGLSEPPAARISR